MANTLKFGNGQWATGNGTALAYNDENANFKPLPFDFTRASSGTTVNQSGLIETVGSGIPRIDFQGNTKGALLLEPQRTNLIAVSTDFSQASLTNGTVTTNNAISPDGTLDADTFICNTVSATGQFVTSGTTGLSYTSSIYVKRKTGNSQVSLRGINNISTPIDVTNQWKRFTITQTSDNGTLRCGVLLSAIGDEVYVWGGQTEQSSYATSYIPTSGSAVTRVADACSQTVPDGVIGQTEGTLFVDVDANVNFLDGARAIALGDGTFANRILLNCSSVGTFEIYVITGGSVSYTVVTDVSFNQDNKVALAYKSNDLAFYANGVLKASTSSVSIPSCSNLYIGTPEEAFSAPSNNRYSQVQLYNTRLSNAELAALTQV